MARPLRIERPGGRYHVTARGNEQKPIYHNDTDRLRFLKVLGQLPERFGVKIHAYVLMDNHYHLMLETPEANLSRAMQWLNVSYTVWFNHKHRRVGHLFQGRFKAIVVETDADWQEVARYVHLNPVRVGKFSLGKKRRAAGKLGAGPAPSPELVAKRLGRLRDWRWSSYRCYAGYCAAPEWLERELVGRLCGGRTEPERRLALRQYTEAAVRQGVREAPWQRLVAGLVLGSADFARSLLRQARGRGREHKELRQMKSQVEWSEIVAAIEKARKEKWDQVRDRHGDWGRDAALWIGRRIGRLKLRELGELAGGMDYAAVAQAVARFGRRVGADARLRQQVNRIESQLSHV